VNADNQTPVSTDGLLYTKRTDYSTGIHDFEHGFSFLESLPWDVLLTPHPSASDLWERVARL
jgi:metallo-beta-lactamase class B